MLYIHQFVAISSLPWFLPWWPTILNQLADSMTYNSQLAYQLNPSQALDRLLIFLISKVNPETFLFSWFWSYSCWRVQSSCFLFLLVLFFVVDPNLECVQFVSMPSVAWLGWVKNNFLDFFLYKWHVAVGLNFSWT